MENKSSLILNLHICVRTFYQRIANIKSYKIRHRAWHFIVINLLTIKVVIKNAIFSFSWYCSPVANLWNDDFTFEQIAPKYAIMWPFSWPMGKSCLNNEMMVHVIAFHDACLVNNSTATSVISSSSGKFLSTVKIFIKTILAWCVYENVMVSRFSMAVESLP